MINFALGVFCGVALVAIIQASWAEMKLRDTTYQPESYCWRHAEHQWTESGVCWRCGATKEQA